MAASLIGRCCQGPRSFVVDVKGIAVVWVTLLYAVGRGRSGALQAWVGTGTKIFAAGVVAVRSCGCLHPCRAEVGVMDPHLVQDHRQLLAELSLSSRGPNAIGNGSRRRRKVDP